MKSFGNWQLVLLYFEALTRCFALCINAQMSWSRIFTVWAEAKTTIYLAFSCEQVTIGDYQDPQSKCVLYTVYTLFSARWHRLAQNSVMPQRGRTSQGFRCRKPQKSAVLNGTWIFSQLFHEDSIILGPVSRSDPLKESLPSLWFLCLSLFQVEHLPPVQPNSPHAFRVLLLEMRDQAFLAFDRLHDSLYRSPS